MFIFLIPNRKEIAKFMYNKMAHYDLILIQKSGNIIHKIYNSNLYIYNTTIKKSKVLIQVISIISNSQLNSIADKFNLMTSI